MLPSPLRVRVHAHLHPHLHPQPHRHAQPNPHPHPRPHTNPGPPPPLSPMVRVTKPIIRSSVERKVCVRSPRSLGGRASSATALSRLHHHRVAASAPSDVQAPTPLELPPPTRGARRHTHQGKPIIRSSVERKVCVCDALDRSASTTMSSDSNRPAPGHRYGPGTVRCTRAHGN